jgi:molybdenum cofactor cytidylyltransferase
MTPTGTDLAEVTAVILAAGASSRMGSNKLLLPLGDRPLLGHAVHAACSSSAEPVIVVLGRDADEIQLALPSGRQRYVVNEAFANGMATSLHEGLGAIPEGAAGALLLLGDQPGVTVALLEALLADAREHPDAIVAATYAGKRGHPVYFPRHLFGELRTVSGDEGGRSVIARHEDRLRLVAWAEATVGDDVDTREEYQHQVSAWSA